MKHQTTYNPFKRLGGCGTVALILMLLGAAFVTLFGALFTIVLWGTQDGRIGLGFMAVGVLGGGFFIYIAFIRPLIERRKGITFESARTWDSGILTDEIILQKLQKKHRTTAIAGFVITGIIALIIWGILYIGSIWNQTGLLMGIGIPLLPLVMSFYELWMIRHCRRFRIQEDTVIGHNDKDWDNGTSDTPPSRLYKLIFKHHGEYTIRPKEIHDGYLDLELMHLIEIGEKVYLIYAPKQDKILYVFRQKYWTRKETTA